MSVFSKSADKNHAKHAPMIRLLFIADSFDLPGRPCRFQREPRHELSRLRNRVALSPWFPLGDKARRLSKLCHLKKKKSILTR